MHRRAPVRPLVLCAAFAASACSGGGGSSHFVPQGTVSPAPGASAPISTSSSTNLVVTGTFTNQAPTLLSPSRPGRHGQAARGRHAALTFDHIEVTGTLFPGDAAAYTIANTVSIAAPSNGTYSASVPFSNAVAHDNEWAILDFAGVAKDGSSIELGQLGGILNVSGTSASTASITPATTQTLQVFLALLQTGALSTYDLDNTSALASTLASDIKATGATTDPTTGLYDASTLQTIYNALAPKFERDVTITTSPATAGAVTVVQDYTNAEELNLVNNGQLFYGESVLQEVLDDEFSLAVQFPIVGNVIGTNGCGSVESGLTTTDPAAFPNEPEEVQACLVPTNAGTTVIKGIYGGHIIVGATNYSYSYGGAIPTSFSGGTTSVAGEAHGSFKTTVDLKAMENTYTVDDPAGFAFYPSNQEFGSLFATTPYVPTGSLSSTDFELPVEVSTPVSVPSTYSASKDKIVVDTFNPFALPLSDLEICGGIDCYPESTATSQTLTIGRPFEDLGTDLAYFDWKASGSLKSITESGGKGNPYSLDFSASGTGTITSSTASYLSPRESLSLTGSTLPNGTVVTLSVTDTSNAVYSGSATVFEGGLTISMLSVYQLVPTKSISLTFKVPASGTYTFGALYDEGDGNYTGSLARRETR